MNGVPNLKNKPTPYDAQLQIAGAAFDLFANACFLGLEELCGAGSVLVVAPHGDDETLGCGGLIASAINAGRSVFIAILTDGSRSHPDSKSMTAAMLREVREAEVGRALQQLGGDPANIRFFARPDGYLESEGPLGDKIVSSLQALANNNGVTAVFVTWSEDPHPDHRAASLLVRRMRGVSRMYEYPIWGLTLDRGAKLASVPPAVHRFNIANVRATKRNAIAEFRSQLGLLITDDPDGFVLTSDHLRLFCQDSELFIPLQPDDAKPKSGAQSIPVEHFEKLYRDNGDPWGYLTSDYENKKYAATLDMLPQRQFRRGLEIGCSIGVLTRMLAGRCSAVIGIDFVDQAVATASRALADLPHVEILKMTIPNEIPDGDFDLIVLSEVLYFFSEGDMSRLATFVAESLVPGGTCVVVNFRGDTQAVSSGAQALGLFKRLSDTALHVVANKTSEHYEIEVLRRL